MAYAALSSLLQTTHQMLNFDPYFIPCTKKQIESFQETIGSLVAFLDNCLPNTTQTLNTFVTKIRDAAYEAEDVFESLIANHFRGNSGSDDYGYFEMLPQSLEKLIEEFDSMKKEVKKIHDGGEGIVEWRISTTSDSSRSSSSGTNTIMALNEDLMMLVMEQLVGERSKLEIIPIVGMGGIGKTTLTKTLFDSQLIVENFEIRAWVTISQEYHVQDVVLSLLNDIRVVTNKENNLAKTDLELCLYQNLCGRKYLIVLDDVWNNQTWDDIKMLFPDNNCSSRIMLTTRDSKVAFYANSERPYHQMKLLNEDVGWQLLCGMLFRQEDCPSELVEIGKEIAKYCKGLPLAISVIGGLLLKENMTEEYWKYVAKNVNSVIMTNDEQCLEILSLSFNYLPHHLKACFLYFGVFPEDRDIRVSKLIELWIAEGFLKSVSSNSMEEVAKEYLKDLIDRNLILVFKYGSYGKPKTCGIHDLLRDICIREAQKEKFLYVLNRRAHFDPNEANNQRRLSMIEDDYTGSDDDVSGDRTDSYDEAFVDDDALRDGAGLDDDAGLHADTSNYGAHNSPSVCDSLKNETEDLCNLMRSMSRTRSFLCHTSYRSSTLKFDLRLVKVFDVKLVYGEFPTKIMELVNVRYLSLGIVQQFPFSISRFWNLQTIIATNFSGEHLPYEIWEMQHLRHIRIYDCYLPVLPDAGTREAKPCVLTSLQTLSEVRNFRCTEEVLARIQNLRKLGISYYNQNNRTLDWSCYCLNNLVNLCELESLSIDFLMVPNETLMVNLAFPYSLKKMVLEGSQIPWEHMTIIGILPNLEVLKLMPNACRGPVWEPNEEEFKKLKFLSIEEPIDLVEWRAESIHFPSLRHLILRNCYKLEEIPSGIGEIPALETVELFECSPAADSSAKELLGEDDYIKLIIHPSKVADYTRRF